MYLIDFCILSEMNELLVFQFKSQQEINLQSRSRNIHMDKDDRASQKKNLWIKQVTPDLLD